MVAGDRVPLSGPYGCLGYSRGENLLFSGLDSAHSCCPRLQDMSGVRLQPGTWQRSGTVTFTPLTKAHYERTSRGLWYFWQRTTEINKLEIQW